MRNGNESLLSRDPVTFEVINSTLHSICAEMKDVIMRTSFSPLLSLSADLSCVLLDEHCDVIAQGVDIPVHLGAAQYSGRAALKYYPLESWEPGDGVLMNDPYQGGTHLPDVTLMTPVFYEDTLLGFALSRVHWPDIGGIAAGSSSVSDEILKEGVRIPPIKILKRGEIHEDLLRLILSNVRVPNDRKGDFLAALAGHNRATDRLMELCQRYGVVTVKEVMTASKIYSRRLVESMLGELPDAEVYHEEPLDGDGVDPAAAPIVKVNIRKKGLEFVFDFTGSSQCVSGPINAPLPVTASAVYYTVLSFLGGNIAPNSGVYDGVEIIAPEGSIVNAVYPYPVVAANTETANRIVDILFGALGKVFPEQVAAGGYGSACVYTLGGIDPEKEKPFVHYETIGGGMGATATQPGISGHRVHMGNTMNLPIESMEASMPIRFHKYEIVRGSGGDGLNCGGHGVKKVVECLAEGIQASILGERTKTAAAGVNGGQDGKLAKFEIHRDGNKKVLSAKSGPHYLKKGDRLVMITAGGGGWGSLS